MSVKNCSNFFDGKILTINNNRFVINNLFNKDFYCYLDSCAKDFSFDEYVTDELYIKYFQKFLLYSQLLQGTENVIKTSSYDSVFLDVCKSKGIKTRNHYFFKNSTILSKLLIFMSSFALLIKYRKRVRHFVDFSGDLSISRTLNQVNRIDFLSLENHYTDISKREDCVYRLFSLPKKISWIIRATTSAFRYNKKYYALLKRTIGVNTARDAYRYYSKRLAHTFLYKEFLEYVMSNYKIAHLITGKNLDRFAFIEEELCRAHSVPMICYPHGIEYGFTLPKCFTGDVFYCCGEKTAPFLNKKYNTNKFVFDSNVAKSMFELKQNKSFEKRIVVFLTEPNEIDVNRRIIKSISLFLETKGITLYLKLHPYDSKKNYDDLTNCLFIDSFSDSVISNICLARKSTTLIDGLYNGSSVAAILTNDKDREMFSLFPSLQQDTILKFDNLREVEYWLNDIL